MDIKFRTQFDRVRIISDPGSPMVNDYISVYDNDGKRHLEVSGQYSIYDKIQSFRDSCELSTILERFQKTGDVEILQKRKAVFADVTEMPTTYADVLKLNIASEQLFNSLTAEQRLKFNNNPDEFLASIGTDKYNEVFKPLEEKAKLKAEEITLEKEKIDG